jgi:hypothetical protein
MNASNGADRGGGPAPRGGRPTAFILAIRHQHQIQQGFMPHYSKRQSISPPNSDRVVYMLGREMPYRHGSLVTPGTAPPLVTMRTSEPTDQCIGDQQRRTASGRFPRASSRRSTQRL